MHECAASEPRDGVSVWRCDRPRPFSRAPVCFHCQGMVQSRLMPQAYWGVSAASFGFFLALANGSHSLLTSRSATYGRMTPNFKRCGY